MLVEGQNWIRINEKDSRFIEIQTLLKKVEEFLQKEIPAVIESHYWAISPLYEQDGILLTKNGQLVTEEKFPKINYDLIMEKFPLLKELMNILDLEPYIAKNKFGDWGVHRHAYSLNSLWNICILQEDNNNAVIEFREITNKKNLSVFEDPEKLFNSLDTDIETNLIESVTVKTGEIYTLNTWNWHSHVTNVVDHRAECFLLHFKNSTNKDRVKQTIDRLNLVYYG